jgi:hypothetical protein
MHKISVIWPDSAYRQGKREGAALLVDAFRLDRTPVSLDDGLSKSKPKPPTRQVAYLVAFGAIESIKDQREFIRFDAHPLIGDGTLYLVTIAEGVDRHRLFRVGVQDGVVD